MPPRKSKETKESSYSLLTKWLYDGSKTTTIPSQVVDDYSIGNQFLLFFFRGSVYLPYISSTFNNYNLFALEKSEVFTMLKSMIQSTGFTQKWYPYPKKGKVKLIEALKPKFPYLKEYDLSLLADQIDQSEDKESIYESLGLSDKAKKKKNKKGSYDEVDAVAVSVNNSIYEVETEEDVAEVLKEIEDQVWSAERLLSDFVIEEVS